MAVWRLPGTLPTISSGPLGGGIGRRSWVINATVPMSYNRDDPDTHLTEIAGDIGLTGDGVGLLTGVDTGLLVEACDEGVTVWATVGLGNAGLAAAPAEPIAYRAGTINVVARVPAAWTDAALVNAVATVAEAKAQALRDLGYAATGTSTDATCVIADADGPAEPYGGPRSRWGSRLARAVHEALLEGGRRFSAEQVAWSDR
ncbi:adenosylcobinamide amidohydrolase [Hamadaea tsunoensis]|uniref:adenosylcobinamide amidohydrolase n=1 Tax=Hamadaea tsunoensis TaxID=53368 RepID=UPI0006890A8D|nr:adenosylcobinamide amidohydrolase [Hamadaea tsunoensis]